MKGQPGRMTEKQLIEAAKHNPARFAPLYNKYYKPIFIYIFKKLKDEELTGDITSRVFLKALLNIHKYEDRGFPFSSWLYKIAGNEVNMHFRKANKKQQVELNEKDLKVLMGEVSLDTEREEQLELVLDALNQLPLEVTELIDLRFFEQRSFKEMGDILGTTEGNAKIKTYRALDKLKKLLPDNNA
ncbi:RNA polymerase sigma factor [Parvicella tangerina]|uniref:ECF RNA polymerase sigma factor SigX n=1 Tax=Parvicella tangerina TaxID=2829795 RepID=A0A916NI88_9FLAO|nr:sigma-70 family RNA polymerase sigma factor [Parvicella tangerina]CAG5083430.1 ECF RNA polymerase sigma factor SigX [Parvicella tangerina]